MTRAALAAVLAALAGCATVAADDRARFETSGEAVAVPLGCASRAPLAAPGALSPSRPLALTSWNIHKNGDPGWQADLERFARGSDLVLLQEASLGAELRSVLARAGRSWVHADAWAYDGLANGVMTASTAAPVEACVQRAAEPLIALPKSALVAWYRIDGRAETLAVANLHAVNFTPALGAYVDQLDALGAFLAAHRGPVILGGDFNTWSTYRVDALDAFASRLGLTEVKARRGERTRFFEMPADYLFVRGLRVEDAWVEAVGSSDHAPIRATLAFPPP